MREPTKVRHAQYRDGERENDQKLASDSERDTEMDVTVDRQAGRPRLWVRRKGHSEPLALYSYFCIPDTVDPRAPKGKRRIHQASGW